ncbi:MAG: DUF5688 family protein [Clostridiales bacterium]|jgi:hypothetical protein|nr:DUF5688 family protein [Clostridiales bacterium]
MDPNKTLSYQEFVDALRQNLSAIFQDSLKTNFEKNIRTPDGVMADAIVAVIDRSKEARIKNAIGMQTNIYTQKLYDRYQNGENYGDLVLSVVSNLEAHTSDEFLGESVRVTKEMSSYETIADKLIVLPQPYDKDDPMSGNAAFVFEDIGLFLCAMARENEKNYGLLNVPKEFTEMWNMDMAEVLHHALENTARLFPPRLVPDGYHSTRWQTDERFNILDPAANIPGDPNDTYLLSNSNQVLGVVALFYPGVQEAIARLLRDDYYAAPFNNEMLFIRSVSRTGMPKMRVLMQYGCKHKGESGFFSSYLFRYRRTARKLEKVRL